MPDPSRLFHSSALQGSLRSALLLLALGAAACATPPPATPAWRAAPGQVLLLGEVHDNAGQHALRAQALAALLARGDRPALLMEMFDRERQGLIDAVQFAGPGGPATTLDAQVDAVVAAGGASPGWHWPFYRPYIRLALAHGLPIVAANVSRADARRTIAQGLAATGWRADVPDDIQRAQAAAIVASHCGQVDGATAARMANAQVARDQLMAALVARHATRGVVLLAGNGHVRSDIGVPRWLGLPLRQQTHVVGMLERSDDHAAPFDEVLHSAAQPRPDPCAGMRLPAASGG